MICREAWLCMHFHWGIFAQSNNHDDDREIGLLHFHAGPPTAMNGRYPLREAKEMRNSFGCCWIRAVACWLWTFTRSWHHRFNSICYSWREESWKARAKKRHWKRYILNECEKWGRDFCKLPTIPGTSRKRRKKIVQQLLEKTKGKWIFQVFCSLAAVEFKRCSNVSCPLRILAWIRNRVRPICSDNWWEIIRDGLESRGTSSRGMRESGQSGNDRRENMEACSALKYCTYRYAHALQIWENQKESADGLEREANVDKNAFSEAKTILQKVSREHSKDRFTKLKARKKQKEKKTKKKSVFLFPHLSVKSRNFVPSPFECSKGQLSCHVGKEHNMRWMYPRGIAWSWPFSSTVEHRDEPEKVQQMNEREIRKSIEFAEKTFFWCIAMPCCT